MAERTFELPDLGEGIAEGELVSWLVAPGDGVEEDQTIAEVETDKALVEVPSPYDGVVTELHYEEGETVPVDSVVATFRVNGDGGPGDSGAVEAAGDDDRGESTTGGTDDEPPTPDGRVFAAPSTRALARELAVDIESVEGFAAGVRVTDADVRAAAAGGSGTDGAAGAHRGAGAANSATIGRDGAARERTLAMPATRRLAGEEGVDLNDVPASEERDGEAFVTPADVRTCLESRRSATGTADSATTTGADGVAASAETATATGTTAGERVPYGGVRRAIGERMVRSKYTAPHVSHHDEFDAADLVAVREELAAAAEREGVTLTYLPFVIEAVTTALREFPYLNSSLDEEAGEIVLHDEYNVGIAVDTDAGLMVPVVKHADRKGLRELAAEVRDLAERARNRELSPEEMRGGTFTITNVGVIGGEFSSPIINHPEAAVLAMGPIRKRPWVVDDEVVARETLRLSMSVDHRLVDGADAARFSNRVKELLANPALLLLD